MQTDCFSIAKLPKLSRLFLDYTESHEPLAPFFTASPYSQSWMKAAPQQKEELRNAVADLLTEQNRTFGAGEKVFANIERLRQGAGAVVTGQQVILFGGPVFTLYKTASAIRKAQAAGAVPIFWLATEDHDLDEADQVTLPSRHELHTLRLELEGQHTNQPVGGLKLGQGIRAVLDQAAELLGPGPVLDLLESSYTPDATFATAFAQLISKLFADYGLIVIDAADPRFHALGAPVLRQAIERAAELETALHERDKLLAKRGYHSQVLVTPNSSLLFLIDEETGARLPLKRKNGDTWVAAKKAYSTADLLKILETQPERLSPNALLRPVFQDFLLPTMAYIGGPAEIAYFAQTQVLYEAILGRTTPILPRLSATLIEPAVAKLLAQHELLLEDILQSHPDELAQRLGARSMPVEGKRKLANAGNTLDQELESLTTWMSTLDDGLGRASNVAASKMRYQMNRLRRLAANYQLQKETSLRKHIDTLYLNLFPNQHPQERIIGAVAYVSLYGDHLIAQAIEQAAQECPGHRVLYL